MPIGEDQRVGIEIDPIRRRSAAAVNYTRCEKPGVLDQFGPGEPLEDAVYLAGEHRPANWPAATFWTA